MKKLTHALAALALSLPLLGSVVPAQALTSHQYMTQGRGHYTSSTKRVGGMGYRHHWRHRYHHRSMHRR